MEYYYTILAMLTAGVSLAGGLLNLVSGLHKDGEKTDLMFGILALCVFTYLMLPPAGFILIDQAPYPAGIIIKRLFIYTYYLLLPWFLKQYTGYKKRGIPIAIDVLLIISLLTMATAKVDSMKPWWLLIVLIPICLILYYGLVASVWQMKRGSRARAKWLFYAMIIYAMLLLPTVVNQLGNNYFGKILGTKVFFPFHLHLFAFVLIMSLRLRENIFEKYRLEKILRWRDLRWNSLVQNMHLLLVELDMDGNIKHLNPCAVNALGLSSEKQWLNKNWFDHFVPKEDIALRKFSFAEMFKNKKIVPSRISSITSKDGREIIVNWTNVFVDSGHASPRTVMSIGMDITEQRTAFKQIQELKQELEKENLLLAYDQLIENEEYNIIGKSESIVYAIQKAKQVASTNAAVLLEGETGVGKELFANLIHQKSYRNNKPFVKINCAALPPELIESELFGHEKGSFTSAVQSRKGRFELADGGTIFLDEIGELPLSLQPKLLRVLQNGEFERIGGQHTIKVDVRIVSATNRNLLNEVKEHHFREDLYYRLNVYPITIPPLRNRKEDIPALVTYLVKNISQEHHKEIENISKADMTRLTEYSWPGNVRELINLIERSVISTIGNTLKLDWVHRKISSDSQSELILTVEEIDRAHILKVLNGCGWKINGPEGAAEKLGLNPNTLRSRLKKLHITRNQE
jgi:PAS domain S-box-containing protein